jgi:hypothetical protein
MESRPSACSACAGAPLVPYQYNTSGPCLVAASPEIQTRAWRAMLLVGRTVIMPEANFGQTPRGLGMNAPGPGGIGGVGSTASVVGGDVASGAASRAGTRMSFVVAASDGSASGAGCCGTDDPSAPPLGITPASTPVAPALHAAASNTVASIEAARGFIERNLIQKPKRDRRLSDRKRRVKSGPMRPDLKKAQKRRLTELGSIAYERDLSAELGKLESEFESWRAGRLDAFDLAEAIPRFHQGPARELFSKYQSEVIEFAVAHAIARGILSVEEAGPEMMALLGGHVTRMAVQASSADD